MFSTKIDETFNLSTPLPVNNTKTQNSVAILSFENPYWVWFLIHKSVVTLS
ncbi:hypothetical protein APA_5005 [Pseudanabaena sp. lw0831]|nr:hypothetical protein APA_5005 [Pseudanabaena sp. lw0831]